jgi:hypothetical protein
LLTKPEEVLLGWEVSGMVANSSVSGRDMRSRLILAGIILRGKTRLDVVKLSTDGFSKLV